MGNFLADMNSWFYYFGVTGLDQLEVRDTVSVFLIRNSWGMDRTHAQFPAKVVLKSQSSHTSEWEQNYIPKPFLREWRVLSRTKWEYQHMKNIKQCKNKGKSYIIAHSLPWRRNMRILISQMNIIFIVLIRERKTDWWAGKELTISQESIEWW